MSGGRLLRFPARVMCNGKGGAAFEEYNRHADDPRVAGAFHLTC